MCGAGGGQGDCGRRWNPEIGKGKSNLGDDIGTEEVVQWGCGDQDAVLVATADHLYLPV